MHRGISTASEFSAQHPVDFRDLQGVQKSGGPEGVGCKKPRSRLTLESEEFEIVVKRHHTLLCPF